MPLSDVTFADEAGRGDATAATATSEGEGRPDRAVAEARGGRGEGALRRAASIGRCPTSTSPSLPTPPRPIPGQKFHVLGGGVARIGGRRFPLRHPHLALVIGLQVTAPETDREHEIRFVLLDPDGGEVAGATGSLVARSQRDARDAVLTFSIDLWNLTFPAPGDYSFRILVNGSERKRLPLLLLAPPRRRRPTAVEVTRRPSPADD